MSRCNVEFTRVATFEVDGERINLLMASWDTQDMLEEYNPDGHHIAVIDTWVIADYDDLSREVQVFNSREEAALDLFGEDDPREVR